MNIKKIEKKKPSVSLDFLLFLALVFLIIAIASFKFKNQIIKELNNSMLPFVPTAVAQDFNSSVKKKTGLI